MQNRPRLLLVSSTKIIVAFVHNGGSITTWPPISRSGFEFSSNFPSCGAAQSFVELSPRRPVQQYQSTSSASGLSEESCTQPSIPFQCRLSSHCCCYCWYSPLLQALLVAPGASLALPAVRLVHLSCFLIPNHAFQVAVNHWQASPDRCCYYHLPGCCNRYLTPTLLMLVALEAAPPSPSWQQPGSSAN